MLPPGRVRGQAPLRPVYATMRIIRHLQLQRAEVVAANAKTGGAVSVACAARRAATEEAWEAGVGVAGP